MVFKSLEFPCVVLKGSFQVKVFLPHISQVVQSSHGGFQAVRLFHLKLVEEHADSGTTQCADESVRTTLIGRMEVGYVGSDGSCRV